ncbi:MAG: acetolactate synthase small subunit [Verrucomicrobiae bacterium]|nr:acetolactate synthase small subunit [Verrucomicrobiae bacterium]
MKQHRHTLSILVENKFGVLARIAGLFSGRGFNIDTLNVAPTTDARFSRMTVVVKGDDSVLTQIIRQLEKLINVIEVQDFHTDEAVERELMLMKVAADSKTRSEVMQIVDVFRAKIVDVQSDSLVVETVGPQRKLDAFLDLLGKFGVLEMTRTGRIAMKRGTVYRPGRATKRARK